MHTVTIMRANLWLKLLDQNKLKLCRHIISFLTSVSLRMSIYLNAYYPSVHSEGHNSSFVISSYLLVRNS